MALRQKTIEYVIPTDTSKLNLIGPSASLGTYYTSSAILLSIPETGSRTIQSAWVEMFIRDSNPLLAGRGNLGNSVFRLNLNGTPYLAPTRSAQTSLNDTGEQLSFILTQPFTEAFTSSFNGTTLTACSMSVDFTMSGGADMTFTNVGFKSYITYNYDDNGADKRVKTVHIPMDWTSSVTSTISPIAVISQVPVLDTFCPEVSKSFKNIWIEVEGSEYTTTAIDGTFSMSLDNGTKQRMSREVMANALGCFEKLYFNANSIDTSTTHSVWVQELSASLIPHNSSIILGATYEYDHRNSNTILNSVMVPFNCAGGTSPPYTALGGVPVSTAGGQSLAYLNIQEPNPITLQQSAFVSGLCTTGTVTAQLFSNTGSRLTKTIAVSNTNSSKLGIRVDNSGSMNGIYIYPLTRGYNPLIVKYADTNFASYRLAPPNGYWYINYTSGKHSAGDGVHNHDVRRYMLSGSVYNSTSWMAVSASGNLTIPETNYYISNYGMNVYMKHTISSRGGTFGIRLSGSDYYRNANGEILDVVDTCVPLWASAQAESGVYNVIYSDEWDQFKRYPLQQPDQNARTGIINPFVNHWLILNDNIYHQMNDHIVYHSISSSVSGALSSYSGTGAGIPVFLKESGSNKLLAVTTSSTGGQYNFVWYDNTIPVYTSAHQDTSHAGASWYNTASLI